MCGIVGYSGKNDALKILLNGLSKLEYRGYDSAGIAFFERGGIKTLKSKGRLDNLKQKLSVCDIASNCGIGHTRWATHGEVSDINSHPHSYGKVTAVHNGIIENYLKIKEKLENCKENFVSQTDTEVVPHLINRNYSSDPISAISKTLSELEGSYALGIMFEDIENTVFATRKDSPLIVAVGENENFIASDIPAVLEYTRKYYLLEQNEIAVLSGYNVSFFDTNGLDITDKKELLTAEWDVEAAEKGGYDHFMLKEIHEQPQTLKNAFMPQFSCGAEGILKECIPDTSKIKRLIIVGCGSAVNAGYVGKSVIEKLSRVPVHIEIASEFRYSPPIFSGGDAVIIISQSGETADSLAALRLAKSKNIPVYAIVNVVGSTISREADSVIYINAGPEIAVATTKAYTSQAAVLYALALRLAYDRKTMSDSEITHLIDKIKELPSLLSTLMSEERTSKYKILAEKNKDKHDLFFIGRGQDYYVGMEGSMKIKEVSYIHCEAYAAGELKHGTISLISEGVPCVAVLTSPSLLEKTLSNIKEVKARGAYVLALCREDMSDRCSFCDDVISLPYTEEILMPLLSIVPIQLYAYYTAVARSCDVDKPRNLAKSVTVE